LNDADASSAPPVLLVNEAAVDRFFAGREPIGAEFQFWGQKRRVVGVVANERFQGLAQAPPIAVYTPLSQTPSVNGAHVLLVRTDGNPTGRLPDIRAAVRAVDTQVALFGQEALDDTLSRSLDERRFTMAMMTAFAATALSLAAAGIYAILAFTVARRRREIGVRLALGADPARILRLIVWDGLALTAIGLAGGVVAAALVSRALSRMLFEVQPVDPLTFGAATLFIVVMACAASAIPARRASRVDPVAVLRLD
jgi:predicted lysophospholipase L1 biosynthesis ABC-type transport system permease subunit